jgi:hypothetical protein
VALPARLTDGLSTFEGDGPDSVVTTRMAGIRPYVEWDLGAPTHLVAATAQADNNDAYRLSGSADGVRYEPLWDIGTVNEPGMRRRTTRQLDAVVRFVRFEALSGDQIFAATEVSAYCELPTPWPPTPLVRDTRPFTTARSGNIESTKLLVGLVSFPLLFFWLPRLSRRRARPVLLGILIASAVAWTNVGQFHSGVVVHYWDMFHYFMGSKYFPENGYFELYRCGAQAEREAGRGAEVDKRTFRDLEDGRVYPGEWSRTFEGRCRAHYSPERWQAFRSDWEAFRGQFVDREMAEAFFDHGYNATPLNTAWLRAWTRHLTPTTSTLTWLTRLDVVSLVATVGVLWWGFGAVPATVAAVVLGVGAPWGYGWIGGCLGRQTWLLCAAAGFALLARDRPFWGATALTLSGLLRLFPFVFVGAVGLWALVRAVRTRRFDKTVRHYFAGFAVTMVVGLITAGVAVGFPAYREFAQVFQRHSSTPAANEIGLSSLLAWQADDAPPDPHLTDPTESWTNDNLHHRIERRPLWALAVTVSLGVIVLAAWHGATPVVCAALSGLLLFSLLPMTSYDYGWLVLLIALAKWRPTTLPRLVAFATFTQALSLFGGMGTMLAQHLFYSVVCGVLLVSLVPWRELLEGRAFAELPPPPA